MMADSKLGDEERNPIHSVEWVVVQSVVLSEVSVLEQSHLVQHWQGYSCSAKRHSELVVSSSHHSLSLSLSRNLAG